ncbi:aminoglycoside phosphotransferase family protein [Saccharopolyspora sp. WRP15-2]|uniref:Aminoglycoside phosphotransferase family protein n=1 Tax=Saccharopolyspora oryzae TaxID=2997343 RepID=A0ABT4V9P9_9PSEU|nr:aminoglycoside phosphotransferase family protein [Saccharopolyspora oryzae]MDA3630695.1 aminoglycoside phosphotransferase family protein [Saccharopolyspora oryzae]
MTPNDDERTRAGLTAALAVARSFGLPCGDPRVVSDRGNLVVRLAPEPVVARVATLTAWTRRDPSAWLAREVSVASHAARRGAAVIPPASGVDPGPHERDGFWVSLWSYLPCSSQRADAVASGTALARLHLALADCPAELPWLTPAADQIHDGLAALERADVLAAGELKELRAQHEAVLAELDGVGGADGVLHGDAHPGNLPLADGQWRWTDFEEACRGPREWDLAVLAGNFGADAPTALRAYAEVIGEAVCEPADLAPFHRARELEGLVWFLGMAHLDPDRYAARARGRLAEFLGS